MNLIAQIKIPHRCTYFTITREGPVSGNQEATQIFIKYMYDLVLEISFLDINSQNRNTAAV